MAQASVFDSFLFDPFSAVYNGLCAAEVNIGGCDVVEALVVAFMIVLKGRLCANAPRSFQFDGLSLPAGSNSPAGYGS